MEVIMKFSDYVAQAPGLQCFKDPHSAILACSPLFVKLLGYKNTKQIEGKTDFEIPCLEYNSAEQFIEEDKLTLTSGENTAIYIHTYCDGKKRIILAKKTLLLDKGKVFGINAIAYDLIYFNEAIHKIFSLVEKDGKFLKLPSKNMQNYTLHTTYPGLNLTKQESMCLFYIIRGKSNKEIALLLNLSPRTIEGKVVAIKEKLQCTSRSQIIEKALNNGLLPIIIQTLLKEHNHLLMAD